MERIAQGSCRFFEAGEAPELELMFVGFVADVDVVLTIAQHAIGELNQLSSKGEDGAVRAFVTGDSAVGGTEGGDPARFGFWVENVCLAHAWNAGQQLCY